MTKIRPVPPKVLQLRSWDFVCALIIRLINLLIIGILILSGWQIMYLYIGILIFQQQTLSIVQKIILDYSMTIFAGTALFLVLYRHQMKDIIKEIFHVKNVKPCWAILPALGISLSVLTPSTPLLMIPRSPKPHIPQFFTCSECS